MSVAGSWMRTMTVHVLVASLPDLDVLPARCQALALLEHAQQAAAARQAAEHLRTAYPSAATPPLAALYQHGRRLSRPAFQRQSSVLREAVPELAARILAEPGWYALAATLVEVEAAGQDPSTLLGAAVQQRELGTAESVSDVLVWRLRRTADLPADPGEPVTGTRAAEPSARRTGQRPPGRSGPRRSRP